MSIFLSILSVIHWDVNPVIFKFFSIEPRWYGVLFASSFLVGFVIIEQIFKWENRNLKDLDKLTIYMLVSTVLGARLGHCLFYNPSYYLMNPVEILMVWKGGLASHGAAIGILFALWLFVRKYKDYRYLWIVDRIVIVVAMAGVFIRTGNFFNSEIFGIPSSMPWAVVFDKIDAIPRHPVQMYEAIAYALIFLILFFTYKKFKETTREGLLTGLFLVLIFSARMILEIWKVQQADFTLFLGVKMGQWLSIPFILAGLTLLIRAARLPKPERKKNIETKNEKGKND
jgi:prolipoprotein diacylglyceryl transferase